MRTFRSILFAVWMYGLLLVLGLAFAPLLLGPVGWARFPVNLWLDLVFWGLRVILGIEVRIEGEENIPKNSPNSGMLLAAKHQSMLDVLIPWRVFSFPALILKKELSLLPVFGWYTMKLQNVAVDRSGGASALRKMLRQAGRLAGQGRQILIFPEGTRVEPGEKVPYKPGVAGLYKEMKVPCVPIAFNTGLCWPAHGMHRNPGIVTMRILPPIPPGLDKKEFMRELELRIETATDDLLQGTRP